MIKGFTTVKFAISCCIAYLGLYSIYSLFEIWDEEEMEIKKLIAVLSLLMSIAIMIIL